MFLRGLALRLYGHLIARDVGRLPPPREVALVIADSDLVESAARRKLQQFLLWCLDLGVECVSVYVSVLDRRAFDGYISRIVADLEEFLSTVPAECILGTPAGDRKLGRPVPRVGGRTGLRDERKTKSRIVRPRVYVSVGRGGKQEVLDALRPLMDEVARGRLKPDDIDERLLASRLKIQSEPDLIIRTGEVRLTDFLLWQAAYSEFYFADVNWAQFRKIDLLRAVRDYQTRQRRFGK